jgi:TetR/AcrR family transcriptional repressor of lmrAB and yxaGH operons
VAGDTKQRMIQAATELMRTRGLAATSLSDVLSASGAARGAIYHHFPNGKAELARDAVTLTGQAVRSHLAAIEAETPTEVVEMFLASVRPVVAESSNGAGCAVAAATVDCGADSELSAATRAAFQSWTTTLEDRLRAAGASAEDAAMLAALMIIVLEGSHILCRAAGTLDPFDQAAIGVRAAARATFS